MCSRCRLTRRSRTARSNGTAQPSLCLTRTCCIRPSATKWILTRADELLQYDGSIILERTKGEIAARCDKEEANFLAINLADDVANGRRSVDDARKFYAESMMAMMKENKKNEYLQGLKFQVAKADQGDRDKPFGPVATTGRDKK